MSQTTAKLTLTKLKNGVTYSAMLVTAQGDVRQQYAIGKVVPNWEVTPSLRPLLVLHCIASSQTGQETIPSNITLYYDGQEVPFGSANTQGVATSQAVTNYCPAGMFERSKTAEGLWQIRICKNYVQATANPQSGHTLLVKGEINVGEYIQASIALMASELTATGEEVSITGDPANPFVVNQQTAGSSTTLTAQLYRGGEPVGMPSDYSIRWYKMGKTDWELISGQTGQTLTVSADDIDSYAEYRVVLTTPSQSTLSDTQSVMDIGDPYVIVTVITDPNNGNADAELNEFRTATDMRKIIASLANRNGTGSVPSSVAFTWILVKPDGVVLNNFAGAWNGAVGASVPKTTTNTNTMTVTGQFFDDNNLSTFDIYLTASY